MTDPYTRVFAVGYSYFKDAETRLFVFRTDNKLSTSSQKDQIATYCNHNLSHVLIDPISAEDVGLKIAAVGHHSLTRLDDE